MRRRNASAHPTTVGIFVAEESVKSPQPEGREADV
jgi:hypothetical protein